VRYKGKTVVLRALPSLPRIEQEVMTTIRMRHRALTAVFASPDEARRAHSALLRNGIDRREVAISIDLTRDGIAAEAPGQTYVNQGDAPHLWRLFKWGIDFGADAEEARPSLTSNGERRSYRGSTGALKSRAIVIWVLKEHRALAIWGEGAQAFLCEGTIGDVTENVLKRSGF
jgi:hypothetical protein